MENDNRAEAWQFGGDSVQSAEQQAYDRCFIGIGDCVRNLETGDQWQVRSTIGGQIVQSTKVYFGRWEQ